MPPLAKRRGVLQTDILRQLIMRRTLPLLIATSFALLGLHGCPLEERELVLEGKLCDQQARCARGFVCIEQVCRLAEAPLSDAGVSPTATPDVTSSRGAF